MKINTNTTVFSLIEEGLLTFEQINSLIKKNERAKSREAKKIRLQETKAKVSESLETLLKEPGATVKHRTVWLSVGQEDFTRDEVLNALRALRDEGVLQNIKTSNNNFQVFWAYVTQEEAQIFGTINDLTK